MGDGQKTGLNLAEAAKAISGIWLIVAGYFFVQGLVTLPTEGDSLSYHLPIANLVLEAKLFDASAYQKPFWFYPGMSETFLAGMAAMGWPLNLFNLIGWGLLTLSVYGLFRVLRFDKPGAVVAAVGVVMWPSVVRLVNNQTIDIWLAVWWTASAIWWEREKQKTTDWLWLGIFMGMMAGTKVSGWLYVVGMIAAYWRKIYRAESGAMMAMLAGVIFTGGWWYFKNWLITGNPIYPAGLLGFKGDINFGLMDWSPLKTLILYPGGAGKFVEAVISEYLIWGLLLILPIWIRNRWVFLGWINFLIFLFLPSWPVNIVSDLRYLFVAFVPLTVAVWKLAMKNGFVSEMAAITTVCVAAELTQLDFRPKIWFAVVGLYAWFLVFNKRRGIKK